MGSPAVCGKLGRVSGTGSSRRSSPRRRLASSCGWDVPGGVAYCRLAEERQDDQSPWTHLNGRLWRLALLVGLYHGLQLLQADSPTATCVERVVIIPIAARFREEGDLRYMIALVGARARGRRGTSCGSVARGRRNAAWGRDAGRRRRDAQRRREDEAGRDIAARRRAGGRGTFGLEGGEGGAAADRPGATSAFHVTPLAGVSNTGACWVCQ